MSPVRRALVLGASGQLGQALRHAVTGPGAGAEPVWASDWSWHWAERQQCDLSKPGQAAALVQSLRPDLVINAAAYTAVDRAESEPAVALQVNATAVAELARAVHQQQGVLVHFSTDFVFDGRLGRAYSETDPVLPLSVYGRTKLAGEQALQSLTERHLIFRTSWLYGRHGENFLKTIWRLAQQRDALRVVADQWGIPTAVQALATACLQTCRLALLQSAAGGAWPWGLYHLSCTGEATTWHAYACHVIERAAQWGVQSRVSPAQVHAIDSEQFGAAAQRPPFSPLDCSRWQGTFGLRMPDWRDAMDEVLADVLLEQGVLSDARHRTIVAGRGSV